MNPIYRFELTKNGADAIPAFPVYRDDLTIDYALQQGEEFYRGTLSGKLTFQSVDFDYINTADFDTRFGLVIYISYDGGHTWAAYWRGKFYKTDCDFNDDDKTAIVTPTLDDQYCAVLAGLEKEYDLIQLAPEISRIRMDKRPMMQYYVAGSGATAVGCFLSGMWWEQECGEPESAQALYDAGFTQVVNKYTASIKQAAGGSPQIPTLMQYDVPFPATEDWTMESGGYVLECFKMSASLLRFAIYPSGQSNNWIWSGDLNRSTSIPIPGYSVHLTPVSGSAATGDVDIYIELYQIWARIVTDKETQDTIRIEPDDIVQNMRNYRYCLRAPAYISDTVVLTQSFSETPTEWGLYEPGKYYAKPNAAFPDLVFPLCRSLWTDISIWVDSAQIPASIDEDNRAPFYLRHAFPIASVISALIGQFAPGITHQAAPEYSRFLYDGADPLTFATHYLFISPKSNILSAGYDQPAQTAKITLRSVLDMLRDCFRCFWFIDEQNRLRIEHIEYFRRGGSYSSSPRIGIDLTTEKNTRNGKPWAYVRNQYRFDKPAMVERYQFGWMDDVTDQFEGQPIDIVSGYVEPGNIENVTPNQFTSDVDYMLLNPGACSKDGYALLSAVISAGEYMLPYGRIGESQLQNVQLCWPYLQIYYVWDMPARQYKIGASQYRATGVKKLKTQSLKFPVLQEPNFYELVKTELGNGTIQKLSVNLSSRNANATLKYDYDTE